MNEYTFESDFVDPADQVLHIDCETKSEPKKYYHILIDTWNDPFALYFSNDKPEDMDAFRDILFRYLEREYPGYFG